MFECSFNLSTDSITNIKRKISLAIESIASDVSDDTLHYVRDNTPVRTGLMKASWRKTSLKKGSKTTYVLSIVNMARDPRTKFEYPVCVIKGFYNVKAGRRIEGNHLDDLAREYAQREFASKLEQSFKK